MFTNYPFIKCERVTLNRITDLDLRSLWDIMSDEDNYRYSPTGAMQSKNSLRIYFQRIESLYLQKKRIFLGIYANNQLSKLIGILEISHIEPRASKLQIHIMLNRKYSGRGLAESAVKGLEKYLFETVQVNRIEAYVMPVNLRGQRLLANCGLLKEGTIREGFYWPDKGLVDLDLYAILASDYIRILQEQHKAGQHLF